ncbi:hypothetical protein [Marivita geojedonensis]|uniref:hypothetical protein n=1 Tax=Marivita geojedonensis TaxID=1123756 RepID=UPI000A1ED140|nr:hypothetical protein [Marivita geojedonensis]PRY74885.1 uncharacterized protein YutE (UPF0331/DUF86 family) [Marivita geojedonensis]
MSQSISEYEAARELARKYELDGYTAELEPKNIPGADFLGSYRPDLLLERDGQKIIVEIKRRHRPELSKHIEALKNKIEQQPGWKFLLVYLDSDRALAGLKSVPYPSIRSLLNEAEAAFDTGSKRAAFLSLWAGFEAAARRINPEAFSKPQSPGRIITVLAENGTFWPDDADELRRLAAKRNSLIHGELDVEISDEDYASLMAHVETLAEERSPPEKSI